MENFEFLDQRKIEIKKWNWAAVNRKISGWQNMIIDGNKIVFLVLKWETGLFELTFLIISGTSVAKTKKQKQKSRFDNGVEIIVVLRRITDVSAAMHLIYREIFAIFPQSSSVVSNFWKQLASIFPLVSREVNLLRVYQRNMSASTSITR